MSIIQQQTLMYYLVSNPPNHKQQGTAHTIMSWYYHHIPWQASSSMAQKGLNSFHAFSSSCWPKNHSHCIILCKRFAQIKAYQLRQRAYRVLQVPKKIHTDEEWTIIHTQLGVCFPTTQNSCCSLLMRPMDFFPIQTTAILHPWK